MATPQQKARISTIATFPPGFFLENIAGDTSHGVYITVANRQEIYLLRPPSSPAKQSQPFLIESFERRYWVMGICQAPQSPNVFYVLTTNGPTAAETGSLESQLRVLDASNPALGARTKVIMTFPPGVIALNGFCALSPVTLIAADSFASTIWRIDLDIDAMSPSEPFVPPRSARCETWLVHEPTMEAELILPDFMPGTNGLKYCPRRGCIYYTSTQKTLFCRVAVDTRTLAPAGEPEVLARGWHFDDLIMHGDVAYVTTHRDNSIVRIPLDKADERATMAEAEVVVQGGDDELGFLGPTAGVWESGREGKVAWFLTDGGLKHPARDGLVRTAKVVRAVLDIPRSML